MYHTMQPFKVHHLIATSMLRVVQLSSQSSLDVPSPFLPQLSPYLVGYYYLCLDSSSPHPRASTVRLPRDSGLFLKPMLFLNNLYLRAFPDYLRLIAPPLQNS